MSINFISILIILITYVASYICDICFQVKRQTVYKRDKLFIQNNKHIYHDY